MNVLLNDIFMALKTLRFSNLTFNYTSRINYNRKLNFRSKMGDTGFFLNVNSYYNIGGPARLF